MLARLRGSGSATSVTTTQANHADELEELDRRYVFHPFTLPATTRIGPHSSRRKRKSIGASKVPARRASVADELVREPQWNAVWCTHRAGRTMRMVIDLMRCLVAEAMDDAPAAAAANGGDRYGDE